MEPLTRKEFFLNAIAEGTPTPAPLTREERYLAKIAENTGGDSLPPIEEGDDGKVLTASDGQAVWASGGGGGGDDYDVVIKCRTWGSTTLSDYEIVKGAYSDIANKAENGNPVLCSMEVSPDEGEDSYYSAAPSAFYIVISKNAQEYTATFLTISPYIDVSESSLQLCEWDIVVANDEVSSVSYKEGTITSLA